MRLPFELVPHSGHLGLFVVAIVVAIEVAILPVEHVHMEHKREDEDTVMCIY